jgi:heat shock protein HslJ
MRKRFPPAITAVAASLALLASCASVPEPPAEVAPVAPPIDAPDTRIVYRTSESVEQDYRFTLALYEDGSARLETRLPDESPPFLELGLWEAREQMMLVVITRTRRLDYDAARPILFEVQGSRIVARDYDQLFYGNDGMDMSEVDASDEPLLADTSWRLTRLDYGGELYVPGTESEYTLRFSENGTLNAGADCNRATGLYSDIASFLTLSSLVAAEAACEADSFSHDYVTALRATRRYEVIGSTLVISGENGLEALFESM